VRDPNEILEAVRDRVRDTWHLDVPVSSLTSSAASARAAQSAATSGWPCSFELGSPTQVDLEERFDEFQRQAVEWQRWSEAHGVELTTSLRRVNGNIESLPTHVVLADLDSAATLVGGDWMHRIARGREHAALLRTRFPGVAGLAEVVRAVDRYTETDFDLLCTTARWFRQDQHSGLTPRQVPIDGFSEGWLRVNERLVLALAGIDSLGLVSSTPQRIHFSYLDPDHLSEGGRRCDCVTVGDVAEPAYRPDFVLISEDAQTALQIPTLSLAISVEGNGLAGAAAIASLEWIQSAGHVVYWGDLDVQSLQTLNRLRAEGLTVHSILMDIATFDRYERYGTMVNKAGEVLGSSPARQLPHLTDAEQQLFDRLGDPDWTGPRRIEQERIPMNEAAKAVAKVLASRRLAQQGV
jgi:hypothetical protein